MENINDFEVNLFVFFKEMLDFLHMNFICDITIIVGIFEDESVRDDALDALLLW